MPNQVDLWPLDFYVDKLNRGESFHYLSYGDGELLVAAGKRTGRAMQCGEFVTSDLVSEIKDSLLVPGEDIYRGTDPNILNWREYQGQDFDVFSETGRSTEDFLQSHCPNVKFVDGVVWEYGGRFGNLKPLIDALRSRIVVLIANANMVSHTLIRGYRLMPVTEMLRVQGFVSIPKNNAWSQIKDIERHSSKLAVPETTFVACMGLGAIPLAMRLKKKFPNSTFLDLGSTFDFFCGLGSTRGWRKELYRNTREWQALVKLNLGDLIC